jgi:hypothetical protein
MSRVIRIAADQDDILSLIVNSFEETRARRATDEEVGDLQMVCAVHQGILPERAVAVVVDDDEEGRLLGAMLASRVIGGTWIVSNSYLAPPFRQSIWYGVMVKRLLEEVAQKGATHIEFRIDSKNDGMLDLCKRHETKPLAGIFGREICELQSSLGFA